MNAEEKVLFEKFLETPEFKAETEKHYGKYRYEIDWSTKTVIIKGKKRTECLSIPYMLDILTGKLDN